MNENEKKELTFGQKAVGINVNVADQEHQEVEKCKQHFADAIDQLNDIRSGCELISGSKARLISTAITEIEGAKLRAVAALTWND